jgi:hypothetical protein
MKPADVFAVAVRLVGLVICLGAGAVLGFAVVSSLLGGPASAGGLVILGTPPFLVGLWLLRGAPSIVAFAFPDHSNSTDRR